jgi:RNA polymerase sigma-70 factor, ECF subfamily
MAAASPETSLSLLEELRDRHNGCAWDRVGVIYTSLLRTWFRAAGLQSADCDDLTQRVLEVLVRRVAEFEHNGLRGAFRAWLKAITVNLLREFWRQRPTPASASALDELTDPHGGLSQFWDRQHDLQVLQSLLDMVRPEFADLAWTAFCRTALDGVPTREVAAELDITVNAVLISKSRVLARLRREARGLVA